MGLEVNLTGGQLPTGGPQAPGDAPAPVPAAGGTPDAGQARSQALSTLVQQMLQRMKPRSEVANPSARPGYGADQMKQGEYVMGNQGSNKGEIGAGLFNIGTAVKNAVAAHKEKQVQGAMADWNTLQTRWDNSLALAGGDQQKAQEIYEKDPYVIAVLGDTKKTKNLSKVFNVDLMNPGKAKDSVHGQALERHMKVNKAKGMLDAIRQKLHLSKQKQTTPSPEQRQQTVHENAARLPMQQTIPDPTKSAEFLEKMREFDTRDKEAVARIGETRERTQELIRHNHEMEADAQERIANTKLANEDRVAARKESAALRQQAQELHELQVMLQAAGK